MSKPVYLIIGSPEEDYIPYGIVSNHSDATNISLQIDKSSIIPINLDELSSQGILWLCQYGLTDTLWTIEAIPNYHAPTYQVNTYGAKQPWAVHSTVVRAKTKVDALEQAKKIITEHTNKQT